jgi:hypothetical protein
LLLLAPSNDGVATIKLRLVFWSKVMKPFTSVVLAAFLAAAATFTFGQSVKADVVVEYDHGGDWHYREYRPNYRVDEYQEDRPDYYRRIVRDSYPRPYNWRFTNRRFVEHRLINHPTYRRNYSDDYPAYYHIRYFKITL